MPPSFVRTERAGPAVIGWREHVSLPDLGIAAFTAKMDTGANYCALHATHIRVEGGHVFFRFEGSSLLRARLIARKTITSSNGEKTKRPLIRTRIKIGRKLIDSEITLIDRSKMNDKMLLGRKLLRHRFVIDPALSYALTPPRKKRKDK
jgi:hypothetical protein